MSKKNTATTLELVSEKSALAFCAKLNTIERRTLAYCIDGEIAAMGLPDGTRPGSNTFQQARLKAVTEIKRREISLEELAQEALVAIDEGLDDDDEKVRDHCKKTNNRINRYSEFLLEEAAEFVAVVAANTSQDWDEAA